MDGFPVPSLVPQGGRLFLINRTWSCQGCCNQGYEYVTLTERARPGVVMEGSNGVSLKVLNIHHAALSHLLDFWRIGNVELGQLCCGRSYICCQFNF